jgi:hypothetical protein
MTVDAGVLLESRRTLRRPKLDILNDAVRIWFCQERGRGTLVSGPRIKENALISIKKMDGSNEECTNEVSLNRRKKRHGVYRMGISGGRLRADHIAAENFIKPSKMLINNI